MVFNLGHKLGCSSVKAVLAANVKADQEDVCLGVGEGPQAVIVLLPCSVPQAKAERSAIVHHIGAVVVEHCRDVGSWECVCSVGYQHAGLANTTSAVRMCVWLKACAWSERQCKREYMVRRSDLLRTQQQQA